jgi:hypothetical protein
MSQALILAISIRPLRHHHRGRTQLVLVIAVPRADDVHDRSGLGIWVGDRTHGLMPSGVEVLTHVVAARKPQLGEYGEGLITHGLDPLHDRGGVGLCMG